jgi:hypothetical protein
VLFGTERTYWRRVAGSHSVLASLSVLSGIVILITFLCFEGEIDRRRDPAFRFVNHGFPLFAQTKDIPIVDGIGRRGTETKLSVLFMPALRPFRTDNEQIPLV